MAFDMRIKRRRMSMLYMAVDTYIGLSVAWVLWVLFFYI